MKAFKNNIREVIEIFHGEKLATVQVEYFSGKKLYFMPDKVPDRVSAFMRWSRTVKEYPVCNSNTTTRHYY